MATTSIRNPLTRILAAGVALTVCVLAAELLALTLTPGGRAADAESEALALDTSAAAEVSRLAPAAEFQESVDRSLFAPDRKPKDQQVQLVLSDLAERWALTGIVNTGDTRFALFTSVSGEERMRVETGEAIEQWRITGIESQQIFVTNAQGEQQVLPLKDTPIEAIQSQTRLQAIQAQGFPSDFSPDQFRELMSGGNLSQDQRRELFDRFRETQGNQQPGGEVIEQLLRQRLQQGDAGGFGRGRGRGRGQDQSNIIFFQQ